MTGTRLFGLLVLSSMLPATLLAQKDRIAGEIDAHRKVALKGNVNPLARLQFDQGAADPAMKLNYVILSLKTSAEQQAALDRFLTELQDRFSPNYHKFLTPEQFADRFGASRADLDKIVSWMSSQGFEVISVARGRRSIAFNATVQQIQSALDTQIHTYKVDGEIHYANVTEPSVPAAIEPLVLGFMGLHDFRPRHTQVRTIAALPIAHPETTTGSGAHQLSPGDVAVIYDVLPLWSRGTAGNGQQIVIVGTSDVNVSDIQQFRSIMLLPASDPQRVLVPGATNPGVPTNNAETNLDIEWAGAVAPYAQIIYVFAPSFWTVLNYAIDQRLAPIVSLSYYWCELEQASVDAGNVQSLAQQANAQGITWVACSGDAGAAGCDSDDYNTVPATHGASVSIYTAAPEVTGVGGTTFNEGNGRYWASSNGNSNAPTALSYIPETSWQGSGGGYSEFYTRAAWQVGAGIPAGTARGVPDVAFSAAPSHDGYLMYMNGAFQVIGGTSAGTPVFAGIVALLNQYLGANGLGNINPNLYRMAQNTSDVFHDVTTGNNFHDCQAGTTDCMNGRVAFGYNAGSGWDPVTGLGSVDAYRLAVVWNQGLINTTTAVTANPTSITLSGQTQLTVTVSAVSSSMTPTGNVAFTLGNTSLGTATLSGSGAAATASITVYGSQLSAGNNTINANYGGDSNVNGSAGAVTISVSVPVSTSAVIPAIVPNPVFEESPDADGYSWFYTVRLTEVAGVGTTLTGFTIDGTDYSSSIADFFGTASIPANGALAASLRATGLTVPATRVFEFKGQDKGGHQWVQQIAVPFFGIQVSAAMDLVGVPGTVRQDPTASDPTCQWFQNLGLQELNGHSVQLRRFLAGGQDLSDSIADFFGSTTLPAFGSLFTGLCWTISGSLPQTLSYEIDGIDDGGNQVVATQSALFIGPATTPGTLSTSADGNGDFITITVPNSSQSTLSPLSVNVNSGQPWTISIFPSNRTTSWLGAYPLSGTGPATVNITATGSDLDNGAYQATLVVQSVDALPESINVTVTFVVGQPNISAVLNGADLAASGLSPGLIFSIFGTGLGPSVGQTLELDENGRVASTLDGVQVLVDGSPAPLLFVRADQINAVAPYEIAGKVGQHVNVQVVNNSVNGNLYGQTVVATAPAMFSLGNGQGAILNQDGSVNGAGNPAAKGSIITIFGTGEGQTNPPGIDGRLAYDPLANLPRPAAPFSLTIGNTNAAYTYAGTAPTSFAGFFQVDAVVPSNAASGNVPVILTVGAASSPALNVAVK